MPSPWVTRAAGIAVGIAADAAFGDPARHHPVAWFGTWAQAVERRLYRDDRAAGAWFTVATVAPWLAAATVVERSVRRRPLAHAAATGLVTWAVVGAASLAREGRRMADHLDSDDLDAARDRLPHLCGRDASQLDAPELARAAVESIAENTADAAIASLVWGAVAGIPGLVAHRALNTLDAMVGHRTERYARFGTTSAVADDVADWGPARLTGALACALAPLVGGDASRAWRAMRRDARKHPSPNGGWCEAAWAGALGVQLGGRNVYTSGVEHRGLLGDGPRPDARATRRAATLSRAVVAAGAAVACASLVCLSERFRTVSEGGRR